MEGCPRVGLLDPVRMTGNHRRTLLTLPCSSVGSVGDAIGGVSTWLAEGSLDADRGLSDREGYRDVALGFQVMSISAEGWSIARTGGRPPFLHPGGKRGQHSRPPVSLALLSGVVMKV